MEKEKKIYKKHIPQKIDPVHIPAGTYLTISDYAKTQGITRMTAYLRMKRGEIITFEVGGKVRLVLIEDLS